MFFTFHSQYVHFCITLSLIHSLSASVYCTWVCLHFALITLWVLLAYIPFIFLLLWSCVLVNYCSVSYFYYYSDGVLLFMCLCVACGRALLGWRVAADRVVYKFTKNNIGSVWRICITNVSMETKQCVVLCVALRMSLPTIWNTNGPSCKVSDFMTDNNTKFHGKPRWYKKTNPYEAKRRLSRLCERA